MHTATIWLSVVLALHAVACFGGSGRTYETHNPPPSEPDPLITLELDEIADIDFDDMAEGVAEEAVIAFDDLRSESRYLDLRSQLVCAGLDRSASAIEILELRAAGSLPIVYQIDVAPYAPEHDTGEYTPEDFVRLAELNGVIDAGEVITLDDVRVTVFSDGDELLRTLPLSDAPRFSVLVTAEALDPVDELLVEMTLQLDLASRDTGCP